MPYIHNREYLKVFRKSLRNSSTASEASLWNILKNKQVGGLKFRRQHSVGNYILDFYCPQIRLCIELDGEWHANPAVLSKDIDRDKYLEKFSITVLRYENRYVYEYPEEIVKDILNFRESLEVKPE
jgi:very-short-patch-repair endonuclease